MKANQVNPDRVSLYTAHINSIRGVPITSEQTQRLVDFHVDKAEFKYLLTNSPQLHDAFYNRTIWVNLHTDGYAGHVSADLPILKDGVIVQQYQIGLSSAVHPIKTLNVATTTPGRIHEDLNRLGGEYRLLKAPIRITEEQYLRIATSLASYVVTPPKYNLLSTADGLNCIYFMDMFLKENGVIDGLHNKFNFKEFIALRFKPITPIANLFFDEFRFEQSKVSIFSADLSPLTEAVLLDRDRNQLDANSQSIRERQFDTDIDVFTHRDNLLDMQAGMIGGDVVLPAPSETLLADFRRIYDNSADSNAFTDSFKFGSPVDTAMKLIKKDETGALYKVEGDSAFVQSFASVNADLLQNEIGNMALSNVPLPGVTISNVTLRDSSVVPQTRHNRSPVANDSNDKKPFITDARIGIVGGVSVGVLVTLSTGGVVGVAPAAGGFVVSISAAFGPGFWAAFGSAGAVGLGVAAVILTCQFFYKRHLKKVQQHLQRDLDSANTDYDSMQRQLTNLQVEIESVTRENVQQVLRKIDTLTKGLDDGIQRQNSRAKYARKKKKNEIRDIHTQLVDVYGKQKIELDKLRGSLVHEVARVDFINENQTVAADGLLNLLKDITNKAKLTDRDAAQLEGLRELIVGKMNILCSEGKLEQATVLINTAKEVRYSLPGKKSVNMQLEDLATTLAELNSLTKAPATEIMNRWATMASVDGKVKSTNALSEGELVFRITAENHVLNEAFIFALSGKLDEAKSLFVNMKESFPDSQHDYFKCAECVDIIRIEGDIASEIGEKKVQIWVERHNNAKKINPDLGTIMLAEHAKPVIETEMSRLVVASKFSEAKNLLNQFKLHDSADNESYLQHILLIENNQENTPAFFLGKLREHNNQEAAVPETNNRAHQFGKSLLVGTVYAVVNKQSAKGYYGHAANALGELDEIEGGRLGLVTNVEDLRFHHVGQLGGALIRPVQEIIAHSIHRMEDSSIKTAALVSLEAVTAIQTILPNAMVLAGQSVYYRMSGNTQILLRNWNSVRGNLFNIRDTQGKFNVGIVLGSLALQALRLTSNFDDHLSAKTVKYRNMAVNNGSIGLQIAVTANSGYQVGYGLWISRSLLTTAYSSQNLAFLAKAALDAGFWAYHKYCRDRGKMPESRLHYQMQTALGGTIIIAGMAFFAGAITGGLGWAVFAGALCALPTTYSLISGDPETQAIIGALQNIHYHSEKKAEAFQNSDDENIRISAEKIRSSLSNIEQLLVINFNGIRYRACDNEAVNFGRLTLLHSEISIYMESQNFSKVLDLTIVRNTIDEGTYINDTYKLPPHLAWNIIVSLRLVAICMHKLIFFHDEYNKYSKYIFDNAKGAWYNQNWEIVKKELNEVIRFAFIRFIEAAHNELEADIRINYLEQIRKNYNYAQNWHELMSDEYIFYTAYLYFISGKRQDSLLFIRKISNLDGFLRKMKNQVITESLLQLLEDIDQAEKNKLLMHSDKLANTITDIQLRNHALRLFSGDKTAYDQFMKKQQRFLGRNYMLAYAIIHGFGDKNVLLALETLMKEEDQARDLFFWGLFDQILMMILSAIEHSCNTEFELDASMVIIGLLKLCIDRLLSLENSSEAKEALSERDKYFQDALKSYIALKAGWSGASSVVEDAIVKLYNETLDFGHKCLRGESDVSVTQYVTNILLPIGYTIILKNGIVHRHLIFNVEVDIFSVLNLSQTQAIKLLSDSLSQRNKYIPNFLSRREDRHFQVIYSIMMDILDIYSGIVHERNLESRVENINLIIQILEGIAKLTVHLTVECNYILLQAVALLSYVKKEAQNVNIYQFGANGQLKLVFRGGVDYCEVINILHIKGDTDQYARLHYIHEDQAICGKSVSEMARKFNLAKERQERARHRHYRKNVPVIRNHYCDSSIHTLHRPYLGWYTAEQMNALLEQVIVDTNSLILSAISIAQLDRVMSYLSILCKNEPLLERVAIPIHLDNFHWVGLFVHFSDDETLVSSFQYADPLGRSASAILLEIIKKYFPDSEVSMLLNGNPLQTNICNTGPWLVEVINAELHKLNLPTSNYDIASVRCEQIDILDITHNL